MVDNNHRKGLRSRKSDELRVKSEEFMCFRASLLNSSLFT